jgi:DNA-binding CsgD family transcriptional regulator
MGKTALLEHAATAGTDLRTLRIAGVEPERGFPFAALHRLLHPFLDQLNDLPGPQRNALQAAFGLSTQAPPDPFLIGLATLTLLSMVASASGAVCIIDDAQWIDEESLRSLAFVGRRLGADGLTLLFGVRTGDGIPSALQGLPTLEIQGLAPNDAKALLSGRVTTPLGPDVASQVVQETGGCPLALVELAQTLSPRHWSGEEWIVRPLPISRRLEDHFREQYDALSSEGQTFLLVAAAETTGNPSLVRSVSAALGGGRDGESEAVQQRLLTVVPRVEFRHPLIRSAVYSGASARQRRKVHLAIADTLTSDADADRRLQHLVAIAEAPDDHLAEELAASAQRARQRAGYSAEASLLTEAARFTSAAPSRGERLLDASWAALLAGFPQRAETLLGQARPILDPGLSQANAKRLDGRMRVPLAQPPAAPPLLLDAARMFLPLDVSLARETLVEAFDALLVAQHFVPESTALEIAKLTLETAEFGQERYADLLVDGIALWFAAGYEPSVAKLRAALSLINDDSQDVSELALFANDGSLVANELWEHNAYQTLVERVERWARSTGALGGLQFALIALAVHRIRAGQFLAAEAHLDEMLEVTAAMGGDMDFYRPTYVPLYAWRGEKAKTRESAEILMDSGTAIGSASAVNLAQNAIAILEIGCGNYQAALDAAQALVRHNSFGFAPQMLPLVVEAASRCGEEEIARNALATLQARAEASGTDWALGLLRRAEALISSTDDVDLLFRASIGHLESTSVLTDMAWTQLTYGEWLRRQKRTADARVQLRQALESFTTMGSAHFAERARNELLATGGRPPRAKARNPSALTPQENQIATLAGQRETNAEIAAKLFLSPSTVDYHLRKVFRKLGITTRRDLAEALRANPAGER